MSAARALRTGEKVDVIRNEQKYMGGRSRYSKNTKRERGKIKDEYDCLKCGRQHSRGKCFAFGKRCNKCGKIGHFAIGCRRHKTNTNNNDNYKKASIHEMYNDNEELFISSIELGSVNYVNEVVWEELVFINNKPVNFKLDSGVITKKTIIAYGGNKIKVVGEIILKCMVRKNEYKIKFIVVDVKSRPILGLNACIKLNLISKIDQIDGGINLRNEFINKNLSIFEREKQVAFEHKTQLKENYKAVKSNCRRLPNVVIEKQFVTKNYYGKTALDKSTFAKNENVLLKVRKEDKWVSGKIIDTHQTPRSYIVKEQNVYRRNSLFLRHSNLDSYNKNTNSSEAQKKYQEKVDYKCDKNSSMAQSNSSVVSTKSGRIVKKPSWLSDYC
ncbi:hypothetical protein ILUMI_15788 [Ignelater luminosus]|uniref:CCHC-type domain-containing protein n=1 Tax=Ignelater luminosus TaxID=2038154 RepID=A0A8K0G3I8_IGNLU|nr:hypothetical protein ILUMI_15788 [Ignelater luminosus]